LRQENDLLNAIEALRQAWRSHIGEIEDLTDPNRFFGGNFLLNAIRAVVDVSNFIDMGTIEVTAMTEYILRSS